MVGDEDHGALLDRDRDPLRDRLRPLLPRLHVLPALSGELDQWAEWLVRTRFAGMTDEEVRTALELLARTRDTVLANARVAAADTVADVGAGTGLLTLAAAERAGADGDVLAIDVSADALAELRRLSAAPNVAYLIGSAEVLPLPDESVDVVVTRSVLIYVGDKGEAAREFFRVLRSGGRVSLFEPINRRNEPLTQLVDFGELAARVDAWNASRLDRFDPMLDFDADDLVALFRDAGFAAVEATLREAQQELRPEQLLTSVGAPARRSLAEEWGDAFSAAEVDALTEAVHRTGTIRATWTGMFLAAQKP